MKQLDYLDVKAVRPLHAEVLVSDMSFNERYSAGGIFIPNDDMQVQGVRPRWGKVYAVGPEQTEVEVGQWVMIAHGRWTRGVKIRDADGEHIIRRIDKDEILLITDDEPVDETLGRPL